MTGPEKGFLLLTSHLGDPERQVLTGPQLRKLTQRVRAAAPEASLREMEARDLVRLGYDRDTAERILGLLSDETQLQWYLRAGAKRGCCPITRVSPAYPEVLRRRLGADAPGCLWGKGDLTLLRTPAIALVGSRELRQENREFARQAGRQAALQGVTLISGNARGADREAQQACLEQGGRVISVVADALEQHTARENILYLSEDGFDLSFTAARALSRNRIIHSLGSVVLVAQSDLGKGGTWDGTTKNLSRGWSPVFCFADGSGAASELIQLGANPIDECQLQNLAALRDSNLSFIDQ